MKIRLIKPYMLSAAGDAIDPDEPVALLLIDRGWAIPVAAGDAIDPDEPVALLLIDRGWDIPVVEVEVAPISPKPQALPGPSEIKDGPIGRLRRKLKHRRRE